MAQARRYNFIGPVGEHAGAMTPARRPPEPEPPPLHLHVHMPRKTRDAEAPPAPERPAEKDPEAILAEIRRDPSGALRAYADGQECDLMPALPQNADGFWEHLGFVRVNEEVLTHLGGSWDHPPEVESGWEDGPDLEASRQKAQELLGK